MYFKTPPDVPGPRGPPTPPFSQMDPSNRYRSPARHSPDATSYTPAVELAANPRGTQRWPSNTPMETIEDVLARGYFVPPQGDPVTAVLTDRRSTAWLGLDDAISQVRVRYEIYGRNVRDILYATAAATNALHTWAAERGWPSDRQLDNLGKTLQNLYTQEREERVTLWRDVARIRAELPEAAQTYLSAHRKLQLLDIPGGEAPC